MEWLASHSTRLLNESGTIIKWFSVPFAANMALSLRERVELGPEQLFRLVGVGLSNFQVEAESNSPLFEDIVISVTEPISASNE